MTHLSTELANWRVLRERLKQQFPDVDDADLVDTLDGATEVREAIVAMLTKAADDEMLVVGIKERKKQLSDRQSRLEARIERIRHVVTTAMQETGLRKIEEPEFTVSLSRKPPSVVITDETRIPPRFYVTKRELMKADLRNALKEGEEVPGVQLDNGGERITVRRA